MTQEREAKRNYKAAFEALERAKTKMEGSAKQEEGLRRDLINSFDEYFEAKVGVKNCVSACSHETRRMIGYTLQVMWSPRTPQITPHSGQSRWRRT